MNFVLKIFFEKKYTKVFFGTEKKIFVDKKFFSYVAHTLMVMKKKYVMTLFVPPVLLDKTL